MHRYIVLLALLASLMEAGLAQEKKPDEPRITAFSPLKVTRGKTVTIKILGVKISNATEVRFPSAKSLPPIPIKEKKTAELPKGLEAKDFGETQFEISLSLPEDFPSGSIALSIVTPSGASLERKLRVVAAGEATEEKEPNNGFRGAQNIELEKTIHGAIGADKDVDVFAFSGHAGKKISAEISAQQSASLLDSSLMLYDSRGQQLATNDDAKGRDSALNFVIPADGKYFLAVTDANDRGSIWHGYELTIKEAP
jgi:hypothetical protein